MNEPRIMLSWLAGSTMHGLRDENSDVDTRMIQYDDMESLLLQKKTDISHDAEHDISIISFKIFIGLLLKGAPNMLEGLLAQDECLLAHDDIADSLRAHSDKFMTYRTIMSLLGMARSNIRMMSLPQNDNITKIAKMQCETIRELRVAQSLADDGIFLTSTDTDELMEIKHGGFIRNGMISSSWSPFVEHELAITIASSERSSIRRNADKETYAWCRTMLMEANARTLGID